VNEEERREQGKGRRRGRRDEKRGNTIDRDKDKAQENNQQHNQTRIKDLNNKQQPLEEGNFSLCLTSIHSFFFIMPFCVCLTN
jgi:hypothetical protein